MLSHYPTHLLQTDLKFYRKNPDDYKMIEFAII